MASSLAMLGQAPPERTVADRLVTLTTRAGVIFVGQVVAVRQPGSAALPLPGTQWPPTGTQLPRLRALRPPTSHGSVVEVEFRVDETVAGTATGAFVLREWTGLWSGGTPRYWVGERALVFLLPESSAGLQSPVDDMDGVVPVSGFVAGEPQLDLLRLRSGLIRSAGAPLADAEHAQLGMNEVRAAIRAALEAPLPRATGPTPGLPAIPPLPVSERMPARRGGIHGGVNLDGR